MSLNIKPISEEEHAHNIISHLFEKYKNDPYMYSRTHNYICYQLSNILDNMNKNHIQRTQRIEDLTNEQECFIQSFMVSNQYFYVPSTEKFFYYNGLHYQIHCEDDILYNILSSISKDRQLLCWKQRTKLYIMKRIKENNLLKSIPESYTIQTVLDALYPSIFETKDEAKYFLTVIGDNILKKNMELVHFVDPKAKHFIRELNNLCQSIIGLNLSHTIKHKYCEHDYSNCRLIKMKSCVRSENMWMPILRNNALDLFCVASHYSTRYVNSDNFVMNSSNDGTLNESVFYLKNSNKDELINIFIRNFLQIKDSNGKSNSIVSSSPEQLFLDNNNNIHSIRTAQITWKDMQYLWKQFLDSKNLPSIIYQQNLKKILITNLKDYYKEQHDSFIGICCKHIPGIKKFIAFWEDTIYIDNTDDEMDYEIGELCFLFKKWCNTNNENVKNINDKQIVDLISYFFPEIEIEKDKYIYKIKCTLWDKQLDIQMGLENLKENLKNKYENNVTDSFRASSPSQNNIFNMKLSIYDMYIFYCEFASNTHNNNEQIVSKSYFEKYIFENMGEYVIDDKYISMEWLLS